ncbi:MAG: hypothetical protein PVJ86_02770 [Phycisphaerales bacterium]|jgi:hypothetical protein
MAAKTPFYIGQSLYDVLQVAKRTNRKRLALEFTTEDGRTFHFNLQASSGKERRRRKAEMEAKLKGERLDLTKIPVVKYTYSDCILTFERNRGVDGGGNLCYRVMKIERTEGNDGKGESPS